MLLDVAGALGVERLPDGHAITPRSSSGRPTASSCARATRCSCGSARARVWDDRPAYEAAGGVAGEASRWLAAREPLLVGADNLAWDVPGVVDADAGTTLPGHVHLLVRAGIYIVESLNLEALAADGVREFAFVCLPLKLRGGTGSPSRPSSRSGLDPSRTCARARG